MNCSIGLMYKTDNKNAVRIEMGVPDKFSHVGMLEMEYVETWRKTRTMWKRTENQIRLELLQKKTDPKKRRWKLEGEHTFTGTQGRGLMHTRT